MTGQELKDLINEEPRIPYWKIGEILKVHENTVARRLRRPTEQQAAEILAAIEEIRGR